MQVDTGNSISQNIIEEQQGAKFQKLEISTKSNRNQQFEITNNVEVKNCQKTESKNSIFDKKKQQEIDDLKWQVFDLLRTIKDPEFPQTLEDLKVIQEQNIEYEEQRYLKKIIITWVPTVRNCHFANQIGLSIYTKLQQELLNFEDYKILILVKEDTHDDKENLDKQINDKERIAAAQENQLLMDFIFTLI